MFKNIYKKLLTYYKKYFIISTSNKDKPLKEVVIMKKSVFIKNLENMMAYQDRLAKEGKDFSVSTIIDCERLLNNIPTDDEIKRIQACRDARGILEARNMQSVKDIKDKYNLSWNDLIE